LKSVSAYNNEITFVAWLKRIVINQSRVKLQLKNDLFINKKLLLNLPNF